MTPNTLLHINSSMRTADSVSRQLSDELVQALTEQHNDLSVIKRDLLNPLPQVDEAWITANFTDAAERSDAQKETLRLSDTLVSELQRADLIVLGVPMYNFSIPAALKAWVDLICRARVTFQYTDAGPVGLLKDKRAIVVMTSGGVPKDSPVDFASPLITQIFHFIGIEDVTFVNASHLATDADAVITDAKQSITRLVQGLT